MAGKEPSALLPRWEKKLVFRFATGTGQRVDGRLARAWDEFRLKRCVAVVARTTRPLHCLQSTAPAKELLHESSHRVHLRPQAVCVVANPRDSYRYRCGLRLASHPDPQRTLAARFVPKLPYTRQTSFFQAGVFQARRSRCRAPAQGADQGADPRGTRDNLRLRSK